MFIINELQFSAEHFPPYMPDKKFSFELTYFVRKENKLREICHYITYVQVDGTNAMNRLKKIAKKN